VVRQRECNTPGLQAQDDSERWAAEILAREKPPSDARAETFQGGTFVTAERVDLPRRRS